MPDRDAAFLVEIETAIGYIESFVAGFDEPSFVADSRTSATVAMYPVGARAERQGARRSAGNSVVARGRAAQPHRPRLSEHRPRRDLDHRANPPSTVARCHTPLARRAR